MPSPFPGMDPYLEDPAHWPGVHTFLIVVFAELLNQQLRPRYVADIEERVYITPDDQKETARVPDIWIEKRNGGRAKPVKTNGAVATAEPLVVTTLSEDEIRERRVEIRTTVSGELVTVIELLSPANKLAGTEGWKSFQAKRREVTSSPAHWVEIDLLRKGVTLSLRSYLKPHDYFVHISPVELRPRGRVWPLSLQSRLPSIGIPLRTPDPDCSLDLQRGLELLYERGAYDLKLDYTAAPVPPLPADLAKWSNKLLKQKKLR